MLWGVISLAMVIVFNLFSQPQHSSQPSVTYSEFLRQAAKGEVSEVVIQGNTLTGKTTDGKSFQIYVPDDPGLVDKLIAEKVEVRAEPVEDSPWYMTLLVSWFPMLLLIGVWIFFMRQMQGGAGRAMSFGRSRARMLNQEQGKVTFDDVAGVDEAKEELSEVVAFPIRASLPALAGASPRASCSSALPVRARRCWPAPWLARRACRSSPFPGPTLWKCS